MRLLEGIEKYGRQMHMAIKAMIKDVLNIDIDDDKARELTDKLGLSDILALDTAIDDQNSEAIMDIVGKHVSLEEYSLPGRGNLTSKASTRPERNRTGGSTTGGAATTKPVAGGNKTATGGADEIGQNDNQTDADTEKEIEDTQAQLDALKKKAGIK